MRTGIGILFSGISDIVLVNTPAMGMIMLFILGFYPRVGLVGILCVGSAWGFAWLLNRAHLFLEHRVYLYNPLLIGLSLGYILGLTWVSMGMAVGAGITSFVVTVCMNHIFYRVFKLPLLSFPFFITANLVLLACAQPPFAGLVYPSGSVHLPPWIWGGIEGYLLALGNIIFMPYALAGAIIGLGIFLHSRILFFLSVTGYYAGTAAMAMINTSTSSLFSDPGYFNFILVAMAMGGIYLIPSPGGYWLSAGAAALTALVYAAMEPLLSGLGVHVFTLPFILVTLGGLFFLKVIEYPLLNRQIQKTPEKNLDAYLFEKRRLKGDLPGIGLPFEGEWTVWQGANGGWTHQGRFRHAVDFIICDDSGSPHRGGGRVVQDFYCYGKSVFSPVNGQVVTLVNTVPDNAVGTLNSEDNWGNYIIIQTQAGIFVEISHLSPGSIPVAIGEWVTQDTLVGRCGNSGYSPQPHLHVQVQENGTIGASTRSFGFTGYFQDKTYQSRGLPGSNTRVKPVVSSKSPGFCRGFLLDDQLCFQVFESDHKLQDLVLTVKMDEFGNTFLDSGRGQLFFQETRSGFFFTGMTGQDLFLKLLFKALPSHPKVLEKGVVWQDDLPVGLMVSPVQKAVRLFLTSFCHGLPSAMAELTCTTGFQVQGKISMDRSDEPERSMVCWDPQGNILEIQIQNHRFLRVEGLDLWARRARELRIGSKVT